MGLETLTLGCRGSTASLLRGFVVILYDKAVLEPNFIGMYAQMCERLSKVQAHLDNSCHRATRAGLY
jgi:hypothetical protein